ncbi:hypothetical protein H072_1212 [Dactylellina haptotyla CBS 200.50]|uniref:CBM1 domain-containing protein n=1 Tax=Dactylellina haptotyla (strain CBS 200.50) TaxID=1284197 RepID=S8CAQ5_DACHA|nr:hypothetical protein H072_1212 [Dactylellina haptotyla CBS 200.50]
MQFRLRSKSPNNGVAFLIVFLFQISTVSAQFPFVYFRLLGQWPGWAWKGFNIGKRGDSVYDIPPQGDIFQRAGDIFKRQDDSCPCRESQDVTYSLAALETYMATPYGQCNVASTASNLCPTDYLCVCQASGVTSRCLPTTVAQNTICTTYTGPSVQPDVTRWWLSSTLDYGADPSGQCGGSQQATATTTWITTRTICPQYQACACQTPGYSSCMGTSDPNFKGTTCPVTNEFTIKLPPPSATARNGEQCGGKGWYGPTNCSPGASCYTETSPSPGMFAMCATNTPKPQLRLRLKERGDEGIHVPARVRAIATAIYF